MIAGFVRRTGLWAAGVFLTLGCSSAPSAQKPSASEGLAQPVTAPLQVLGAMPSLQARVEAHEDLIARDDHFVIASPANRKSELFAFSATAPREFSSALRLSRDNDAATWLEMRPVGARAGTLGAIEHGTVVYRGADRDVDVVLSFGSSRLESLSVLRSARAPSTSHYTLAVAPGMQLRAVAGRIEALDASGRVAFRTNATFAVDSAGLTRSVELKLEGQDLSSSFDADGLKYPVVVDPEWVPGPTWPHEAIAAQNSLQLASGSAIVGDAAVIQGASSSSVGGLAAAQLESGALLGGSLQADTIRLQSGSVITGDARFNVISGSGLVRGHRLTPLGLPLAISAPNFPSFTPGTVDVATSTSGPLQLEPGSYRNLTVKAGTTVRLGGGVYAFNAISFGFGSRVECLAACDVRVAARFQEASGSFFGPAVGAGIGPDRVEVFASASNGSASLVAAPAVSFSPGSAIRGRFFAPNGTIVVSSGVQVVGTLVARDVLLSSGSEVVKDVQTTPTCTANDNNPCTQDTCNSAGQPVFTPLPLGASCADANACNGTETCNGVGVCSPGTAPVVDDGNPCTTDSCDATAGVKHQPVTAGTSCSDGNACNGSETCTSSGSCSAGTGPKLDDGNPCTADVCDPAHGVTHTPVAEGTSCADDTPCNGTETCSASGVCSPGTAPSLDDGNPCTSDSCDATRGVLHTPVALGTSCADGNACNGAETCDGSGTCAAGTAPSADDGNPCTLDACDPTLGVTHLAVPLGTSCSDGNACNGDEACNGAGVCISGVATPLDDGNPCTADACDPATGVSHVAANDGSSCSDGNACNGSETCSHGACAGGTAVVIDDGNPCTADTCDAKLGVRHAPVSIGAACSDGNACNGAETCNGSGACVAGTAPVVDDGNPCTVDACSATSGVTHTPAVVGTSCDDADTCNGHEACNAIGFCAAGSPLVVDDGNPCTVDSCDKDGVKHLPAVSGTSCADANVCNGAEQCDGSGSCAAGAPVVVDDGNPCTADSCAPVAGVKHNSLNNGSACDDATLCNGHEVCQQGACVAGTAPVVDDHNPCTADACDAASGVTHTPVVQGTSCADSNLCNGDEVCDGGGACKAGMPLVLDDGNPCTADSCSVTGGATHTPVIMGTSCSDANVCNGAEKCDATGSCAPGTPLTVDDGNPCTADSCDPASGVAHVATVNGTSCADANACNGTESCQQGSCTAGTAPVVDDGNPCTADSCDPGTGVVHAPVANGTSCSNNNACDGAEACDGAGHCASGTAPALDDGNPCTLDACDPASGVSHTPAAQGLSCSDGNACNGEERCDAMGACMSGAPLVLDDGDICTADTCDPTAGVAHATIPGCAGGTPGQAFETRASIMGRVINADGSAVTTFTAEVFNDTLDSPARTDVVTTIKPDGTFRIRLTEFPQSVVDNTPPQHILVRVESDAFPSLLRSAYLLPGDVVALGDLTVLQRDSNVTMIGPEGGIAQDSQGTLQLQIPAGALSSVTPVRLTPIPTRAQFPAPLPNNTVTMYGMEIEPSGTVLALPATLRVKNTLNLPTTMKIPVGTIDARYGDWTHEGFATWDGTRFSTTIQHFSPHDCNGPRLGEMVTAVNDGSGRNKTAGKGCGIGSSTRYASGTLEQGFDVPLQSAAGHDYSLSLNYSSELSGSISVGQGPPQPVLKQALLRSFATPNTRLNCIVPPAANSCGSSGGNSAGGKPPCVLGGSTPITVPSYTLNQHAKLFDTDVAQSPLLPANTEDLEQPYFLPLPADDNGNPARSGYAPLHLTSNVAIAGAGVCVGSGAGFNVAANVGPTAPVRMPLGAGDLLDFQTYQLVAHRRGSPLGSGWAFNELGTLYRTPDGTSADILHGNGQQETFHPYPLLKKVVDFQNTSAISMAVDNQTGEVFAARDGAGILRVDPQAGTFVTVFSGSLFGGRTPVDFKVTYVAGARRFLATTSSGVFEVTSAGVSRQIASFSVPATIAPTLAGVGKYAYFAADQTVLSGSTGVVDAATIQRIDLTDPNRTITTLTPASGGDARLDPHGETQARGFQFIHPTGFAPAFDGGLYVSDNRRHAVYHLAPDAAGEVAADSVVTRILGTGVDTMVGTIGRTQPALEVAIRMPGALTVAADGTLYVVTSADVGGLLAYDPHAQTAHWIGFDNTVNASGSASDSLFRITFRGGSLAPLAKNDVLIPFGGVAVHLTTPLSSQYQPLRTLTFGDTGATVLDAAADVVEQYTWSNVAKNEAPISSETLRSGEPIRSIFYKDADRVDYIQDAAGGKVSFGYDGGGHLSSVTDAAQRVTHFNVDADGNLREVIYPSGEARRFDYDNFRMISSTHPNGEVSTYVYAADGTLQTAQRPGGGTTQVQAAFSRGPKYDSVGRVFYESLLTDDRGVQHAIKTNAAGVVVADKYTADGTAYDVENLYATSLTGGGFYDDGPNRLLKFTNTTVNGLPVGPFTAFDTLGRPLKTTQSPTDPTLRLASSYDATQRLAKLDFGVTVIDWNFTYDAAGHLTKVADVNANAQNAETGRRTTYGGFRAQDGQPTTVTSHGIPTTLVYDSLGLVSSATDTLGRSMSATHDAAGNVTTSSDGTTSVSYGHDQAGRVTSITDAESNTTTLSYETAGCSCSNGDRVTSITTPDLASGQKWALSYDADGDLQTSTTPLGETETYVHNAQRDLVAVTDRAGRPTAFTYDQLGRQSTITDPAHRVGVFNYAVATAASWSGATIYAQSPNTTPAPVTLTGALADGQYQVGVNGMRPGADKSHVALYRDATFQTSQWIATDALDRVALRQDRSASGFSFDSTTPGAGNLGLVHPPFVDELYDDGNFGSPWELPFTEETNDAYSNQFWSASFTRTPDFDVTQTNSGFLGLVPTQTLGTGGLVFSRDAAGRLIGVTLGNSSSALAVSSIAYQPNGKALSVGIQSPVIVTRLDIGSCKKSEDCPSNDCGDFDANGMGKCLGYYLDSNVVGEGFQYDARALVATRTAPGGTYHYGYDSVGRNITLVYPDGHQRTQVFDALGRLTSRCYLYTDGSANHCYTAAYDSVGNPKTLTDPGMRQEITYDDLDRVTQVQRFVPPTATVPAYTEAYAYNALGAFSVYDGAVVDDQRARLSGGGKASAGIPATYNGGPVVLDSGGRVTSYNGQNFQYFNFHHRLERFSTSSENQTLAYDGLERITSTHFNTATGLSQIPDQIFAYSDLGPSASAIVNSPHTGNVLPQVPDILDTALNVGYDGVDHPLWFATHKINKNYSVIYTELDCIGNVRHLHGVFSAGQPPLDLGGYSYSAFGKQLTGSAPGALVEPNTYQPFRWQGKRLLSPNQRNLYDSRARVWSADFGSFLQPDEYVFLSHTGTLWSWPGQNPFRYRDPSGRDAAQWFLNNTSWIDDVAPALAEFAAVSEVPGLAQAGEAALLGINAIDALSSLDAQRQGAAVIAKATSNDEKECKAEGAPPPNMSPAGAGRAGAFNEAKRQNGIPTSQQPESTGPNLDRRGNPQPGKQYTFRDANGKEVIIRDDAEGHDFGDGDQQNRGPHFNDPAGNHYDY